MRLVHLSDLHLGYRQYERQTPGGINQREADVAASVQRAFDATIALAPELVVIAGDVFHAVRPSNPAILHAFKQFSRLVQALPNTTVVIVAGNHDLPRTAETGCILRLFTVLGIHVVDTEARRIDVPERDLSILAVPDLLPERPVLTPSSSAKYNVLVMHGEVEGVLPTAMRYAERAGSEIARSELAAAWDYIALGHYHVYQNVAPNAYYSGSIDYTSTDAWTEMREERKAGIHQELTGGKGLIEHDLATGTHRFHQLPVSRAFVDLRPIDAGGMTVEAVNAEIAERVETCPGGIDGKVVRLKVRDIPRHITRELDYKALREYKRRAMHFHFDPRKPDLVARSASGAPVRRPSLADTVREKLATRVLPPEIDRQAFITLGLTYLHEADARAAAAPPIAAMSSGDDGLKGEGDGAP